METTRPKSRTVSGYFLAVPSERKIPTVLKIVSYSFLLFALPAFLQLIIWIRLIFAGVFASALLAILGVLLIPIIFWFFLSRGLRRCSRGWRICALVMIWLGFGSIVIDIIRLLSVKKFPHGETFWEAWIAVILTCGLLAWQYWVLTRPDIRKLFYPERTQ